MSAWYVYLCVYVGFPFPFESISHFLMSHSIENVRKQM
jgi:hypothetical protein